MQGHFTGQGNMLFLPQILCCYEKQKAEGLPFLLRSRLGLVVGIAY